MLKGKLKGAGSTGNTISMAVIIVIIVVIVLILVAFVGIVIYMRLKRRVSPEINNQEASVPNAQLNVQNNDDYSAPSNALIPLI
jgi:flagellar basal body-associated protein FliL